MAPEQADAVAGAVLGCAVGDALGLPYEGLSKRRGIRLLGEPDRHRFVAGRGMVSDDTEHTCMAAQALCAAPGDPDAFARQFGRRLRWWLLGLPAGIGFATLRATLKLWLGFSPSRSGVFSAGNGPAMRSPVLGAAIEDVETLRSFVRVSTRITHTDPKAFHGAFAVALAAWCAKRGLDTPDAFFGEYRAAAGTDTSDEFDGLMAKVEKSLAAGESTEAFAGQLGCGRGVSGYVYRTVPVVLHSWLSHPRDFRLAVMAVIRCGGDTDSTAAIVGAVAGSGLGRAGIPPEWLGRLWEWPRSVGWMERLAESARDAVKTGAPVRPPGVFPVVGLARNAAFLAVVLCHAARRLLPPY
jgi:ADP-ribosyl-[dinitrogen reductase] hydrolase